MNKKPITTLWLDDRLIWTVQGHHTRIPAILIAIDRAHNTGNQDVSQELRADVSNVTAVLCLNGEPCIPIILKA